jgi:hypothetical protein
LCIDCWAKTKEGGPGRISVAKVASPSKWSGWWTATPGIMYAGGILAVEVILTRTKPCVGSK